MSCGPEILFFYFSHPPAVLCRLRKAGLSVLSHSLFLLFRQGHRHPYSNDGQQCIWYSSRTSINHYIKCIHTQKCRTWCRMWIDRQVIIPSAKSLGILCLACIHKKERELVNVYQIMTSFDSVWHFFHGFRLTRKFWKTKYKKCILSGTQIYRSCLLFSGQRISTEWNGSIQEVTHRYFHMGAEHDEHLNSTEASKNHAVIWIFDWRFPNRAREQCSRGLLRSFCRWWLQQHGVRHT